jgi:hypothetical protein
MDGSCSSCKQEFTADKTDSGCLAMWPRTSKRVVVQFFKLVVTLICRLYNENLPELVTAAGRKISNRLLCDMSPGV